MANDSRTIPLSLDLSCGELLSLSSALANEATGRSSQADPDHRRRCKALFDRVMEFADHNQDFTDRH